MFDKIKQKATQVKNWMVKNKEPLIMATIWLGGYVAGAAVNNALHNAEVRKIYVQHKHELDVMASAGPTANSLYVGHNRGKKVGPMVSELSEVLVKAGVPGDSKVMGIVAYLDEPK